MKHNITLMQKKDTLTYFSLTFLKNKQLSLISPDMQMSSFDFLPDFPGPCETNVLRLKNSKFTTLEIC